MREGISGSLAVFFIKLSAIYRMCLEQMLFEDLLPVGMFKRYTLGDQIIIFPFNLLTI